MERMHFQAIADMIREANEPERTAMAIYFADRLRRTNGRFKRHIFLRACGVDESL